MINIPNPEKKDKIKHGNCSRCGDFGELHKSVWEDPYTGMDGVGWLCSPCLEKTQEKRIQYNYPVTGNRDSKPNDGSHPIPKPTCKKKKERRNDE